MRKQSSKYSHLASLDELPNHTICNIANICCIGCWGLPRNFPVDPLVSGSHHRRTQNHRPFWNHPYFFSSYLLQCQAGLRIVRHGYVSGDFLWRWWSPLWRRGLFHIDCILKIWKYHGTVWERWPTEEEKEKIPMIRNSLTLHSPVCLGDAKINPMKRKCQHIEKSYT